MRERAKAGYSSDTKRNHETVVPQFEDAEITSVWKWIYNMKFQFNKGKALSEYKGIYRVITAPKDDDSKSSFLFSPGACSDSMSFSLELMKTVTLNFTMYTTYARALAQKLCGWGFKSAQDLEEKLVQYENRGRFSKAAALAVFHFNLKRALATFQLQAQKESQVPDTKAAAVSADIPTSPAPTQGAAPAAGTKKSINVQLIAMALSGYKDGGAGALWRQTCRALAADIADPYLEAMFMFLCQNPEEEGKAVTYDGVIGAKSKISLLDKIAFACRFLDDNQLRAYLSEAHSQAITAGALEGLLLTGIDDSGSCVELLQSYLERTNDIQTVALVMSQVSSRKVKAPQVEQWIELCASLLPRSAQSSPHLV